MRRRIGELETLVAHYVSSQSSPLTAFSGSDEGTVIQPQPSLQLQDVGGGHPHPSLRFQKLFLDGDLRLSPQTFIRPSSTLGLVSTAVSLIGTKPQRLEILASYFNNIHPWISIVGKLKTEQLVSSESDDSPRPDFIFLLMAMRLIQHVPDNPSAALQEPLYTSVKAFSASLEAAGIYTLMKLQADIHLTVYEMGHGIFPAAYLSMGRCVTFAIALGIHNDGSPQMLEAPRNWLAWEERRRTWWMLIVLDR